MYIALKFLLLTQLPLILVSGQSTTEKTTEDEEYNDIITEEGHNYTFLIKGGYRPKLHYANFVVSVRSKRPIKFNGDNHMCGGAIISKNVVLTAAHCVVNRMGKKNFPYLTVVAGNPFLFEKVPTMRTYRTKREIVNPMFTYKELRGDLALLILDKNIESDNQAIKPIPIVDTKPKAGWRCLCVGWGRLFLDGPRPDELLYVNLTLQSRTRCQQEVPMNPSFLCAGDRKNPEKGVWEGDSGGPLICNGMLTGIVSFAQKTGIYGYYANVYTHRQWILDGSAMNLKLNVYQLILCIVLSIVNNSNNNNYL